HVKPVDAGASANFPDANVPEQLSVPCGTKASPFRGLRQYEGGFQLFEMLASVGIPARNSTKAPGLPRLSFGLSRRGSARCWLFALRRQFRCALEGFSPTSSSASPGPHDAATVHNLWFHVKHEPPRLI